MSDETILMGIILTESDKETRSKGCPRLTNRDAFKRHLRTMAVNEYMWEEIGEHGDCVHW